MFYSYNCFFCCRRLSERFVPFSFMQYLLWNMSEPTLWFFCMLRKSIKFAIIYVHPNYCGQGSSISLPMIYRFIESLCMRSTYNLFSSHCISGIPSKNLVRNQARKQASKHSTLVVKMVSKFKGFAQWVITIVHHISFSHFQASPVEFYFFLFFLFPLPNPSNDEQCIT